jgi:hypothetical protein
MCQRKGVLGGVVGASQGTEWWRFFEGARQRFTGLSQQACTEVGLEGVYGLRLDHPLCKHLLYWMVKPSVKSRSSLWYAVP